MTLVPDILWSGDKTQYEELLDEWFATDSFIGDEHEKLVAKMLKEMASEPLVLEYLGVYDEF